MINVAIVLVILIAVLVKSSVFILKEYERGVVFLLGRYRSVRGPGLVVVIPFVEKLDRVEILTNTMDVPPQDVITRDNVSIKVNAVLYYRVMDPARARIQVDNFHYATSQLAQTTLRSVCGEVELDELLAKREELNLRIQDIVDKQTDPWGVKVSIVEIKHIDLPQDMQRSMARQAEAERERRAKIIQAEGEYQAADKLLAAAEILNKQPIALQLRYLDTLRSISTQQSSTILFPMPINLLEGFGMKKKD
jgi:regulator of protease activity HflC (stomatin/prohibitin superfamily)